MGKNLLILFLCLLCNILLLVLAVLLYSRHLLKKEMEARYRLPVAGHTYIFRDPDNHKVRFLVDADEWNHGAWSLRIFYKQDDNSIVCFSTACPNNPKQ